MTRTLIIWFCWVASAIFFAWCAFWAPTDATKLFGTAPEFFLFVLGMSHLIGGAILTFMSLGDEADWLE